MYSTTLLAKTAHHQFQYSMIVYVML